MKSMRIFQSIFGLLAALSAKAQPLQMTCPDPDLRESSLDCPWAGLSRALENVTDAVALRDAFDHQVPGFLVQLEKDAKSRQLLNLWGLSRNSDESQPSVSTVPVNLIDYFNSFLNVDYDLNRSVGHAGLNHTYGYLLSTVLTPFGYKRARYVQGEIEAGFGLPDHTFGGIPWRGTLMGNLTYFAGKIAFRDSNAIVSRNELQEIVDQKQIELSEELQTYDFSQLKVRRLVEQVETEKIYLELRTDIVEFRDRQSRGNNEALLIYTLDFHAPGLEHRPRLITAFPVSRDFVHSLFSQEGVNEDQRVPIKIKYNAMLPVTLPEDKWMGRRFF